MRDEYQDQSYKGVEQSGMGMDFKSLTKKIIENYSDTIFEKHDKNHSNYLGVKEMYHAVSDLFRQNNLRAPPQK